MQGFADGGFGIAPSYRSCIPALWNIVHLRRFSPDSLTCKATGQLVLYSSETACHCSVTYSGSVKSRRGCCSPAPYTKRWRSRVSASGGLPAAGCDCLCDYFPFAEPARPIHMDALRIEYEVRRTSTWMQYWSALWGALASSWLLCFRSQKTCTPNHQV